MNSSEKTGKKSSGTLFRQVYDVVSRIPAGKVATYGDIACRLGNPRLARVVGYALHSCPSNEKIPCHRVVNRFGETASAFYHNGVDEQRLLLEEEGVCFDKDGRIPLDQYLWQG